MLVVDISWLSHMDYRQAVSPLVAIAILLGSLNGVSLLLRIILGIISLTFIRVVHSVMGAIIVTIKIFFKLMDLYPHLEPDSSSLTWHV